MERDDLVFNAFPSVSLFCAWRWSSQFANLSVPFQNTKPLDTHKWANDLLWSKLWSFQVGFYHSLQQPSRPCVLTVRKTSVTMMVFSLHPPMPPYLWVKHHFDIWWILQYCIFCRDDAGWFARIPFWFASNWNLVNVRNAQKTLFRTSSSRALRTFASQRTVNSNTVRLCSVARPCRLLSSF